MTKREPIEVLNMRLLSALSFLLGFFCIFTGLTVQPLPSEGILSPLVLVFLGLPFILLSKYAMDTLNEEKGK